MLCELPINHFLPSTAWQTELIFFDYPGPKGSEENQFTPLGDGVKKLIFEHWGQTQRKGNKNDFDITVKKGLRPSCLCRIQETP